MSDPSAQTLSAQAAPVPTAPTALIERAGIEVIDESQRTAKPHHLFWPWFAANVSVFGMSYGSWVLDFGISFVQATIVAIIGIIVSSAVFFFYVANFGNYNATYGALASVIIAMLWGYIVNILLLAGAVLDCEIERTSQLRSGLPAEESLQLEARATTASDKLEDQLARDVERAREVRVAASELDETDEVVVLESPDMPAAPEATETSDAPTGTVAPSGTVATSRD